MNDREYRIGPGAVSLLLVVVVVSMSALGLLALISARGDYRLTERSAEVIVSEYDVSVEAEYALAELDAVLLSSRRTAQDEQSYLAAVQSALPDGMNLEGRIVSWEETLSAGRTLLCEVELLPLDSTRRFSRKTFMFTVSDDGLFE